MKKRTIGIICIIISVILLLSIVFTKLNRNSKDIQTIQIEYNILKEEISHIQNNS